MQNVYKINDGENIFDAAMATYGSLELVYQLIKDNPQLENIDKDLTSLPGLNLSYDDELILPEEQGEIQITISPVKNEYLVSEGQNIFDLALMVYGDVEKVIQLVKDNNAIESINQNFLADLTLTFNPLVNENLVFTKYLSKNSLTISTSDPKESPGSGFSLGFKSESFY